MSLTGQYIGKQTVGVWNTQSWEQDPTPTDADAYPFVYYPEVVLADIQVGVKVNGQLPSYGLTGTGTGSVIFPVTGSYFYTGVRIRMQAWHRSAHR